MVVFLAGQQRLERLAGRFLRGDRVARRFAPQSVDRRGERAVQIGEFLTHGLELPFVVNLVRDFVEMG